MATEDFSIISYLQGGGGSHHPSSSSIFQYFLALCSKRTGNRRKRGTEGQKRDSATYGAGKEKQPESQSKREGGEKGFFAPPDIPPISRKFKRRRRRGMTLEPERKTKPPPPRSMNSHFHRRRRRRRKRGFGGGEMVPLPPSPFPLHGGGGGGGEERPPPPKPPVSSTSPCRLTWRGRGASLLPYARLTTAVVQAAMLRRIFPARFYYYTTAVVYYTVRTAKLPLAATSQPAKKNKCRNSRKCQR